MRVYVFKKYNVDISHLPICCKAKKFSTTKLLLHIEHDREIFKNTKNSTPRSFDLGDKNANSNQMMIAALCPKQNPPSFLLLKVCKYVQLGAKKLRYSEEQIWFYLISCSVLNSAVFENPLFCTMPICNVIGAF